MKKIWLVLIFLLNLAPNIMDGKLTLTCMNNAMAQMMGDEYICEDEFGDEYPSSIPCDEEACVAACTICGEQFDCDDSHFCDWITCGTCHEQYIRSQGHTCQLGGNDNDDDNNEGNGNVGGHGGSGHGGTIIGPGNNNNNEDTPPEDNSQNGNEENFTDPCEMANALSNNQSIKDSIKSLVDDLRQHWPGNNYPEKGWMKTQSGKIFIPTNDVLGKIDYGDDINIKLNNEIITERFHTHPSGATVPSYSDIAVIMENYVNGNVDIEQYNFGIIDNRSVLLITIGDADKFEKFIKLCKNDNSIKDGIGQIIQNGNNSEINLNNIISHLEEINSGLNFAYSEHVIDLTSDSLQMVSPLRPITIKDNKRIYNNCNN